MAMLVRPLRIDDLSSVYTLGLSLLSPSLRGSDWTHELVSSILVDNLEYSLVAIDRKKIIGFLIPEVIPSNQTVKIKWLCVTPGIHAERTATSLFNAFKSTHHIRSIERLCMYVPEDAVALMPVLKKIGFTDTGNIRILEVTLNSPNG